MGTYLNDFEKNKKTTTLFNKKFDFTIAFDDIEQYHSLTQKIYGIAGIQAVQKVYEKSEKEKPKSKKHILTEDHKHWIGLVDSRVTAMPMSFIKKIGLSVESLGSDHFNEYKTNEVRIPKAKRKEVALSRFKGLISIRDYIEDRGSKLQKFHLEASIIGASKYASSIGIDTEKIINKLVAKKPSVKTKKNHGELSKKQIKDRQVYGAIRAYAELMKIDGDMDPNEMMLLGKLTKKEQKKLSGSYNQESDEFKFVWAKEENVFECLKTYNKKEIKAFFNNLFNMACVDGEVKDAELDFLVTFYSNITGIEVKKAHDDIIVMLTAFIKKLKNKRR